MIYKLHVEKQYAFAVRTQVA